MRTVWPGLRAKGKDAETWFTIRSEPILIRLPLKNEAVPANLLRQCTGLGGRPDRRQKIGMFKDIVTASN
jgi:hypothetical protein